MKILMYMIITDLAPIDPSARGFCVSKEKRKFEVKNLFWCEKFSCALACCNQLTLGSLAPQL